MGPLNQFAHKNLRTTNGTTTGPLQGPLWDHYFLFLKHDLRNGRPTPDGTTSKVVVHVVVPVLGLTSKVVVHVVVPVLGLTFCCTKDPLGTPAPGRQAGKQAGKPGKAKPGQARLGQARLSQAGPSQAKPGQATPGQTRPGHAVAVAPPITPNFCTCSGSLK